MLRSFWCLPYPSFNQPQIASAIARCCTCSESAAKSLLKVEGAHSQRGPPQPIWRKSITHRNLHCPTAQPVHGRDEPEVCNAKAAILGSSNAPASPGGHEPGPATAADISAPHPPTPRRSTHPRPRSRRVDLIFAGLRPRGQFGQQLGLVDLSPGASHDRHPVPSLFA